MTTVPARAGRSGGSPGGGFDPARGLAWLGVGAVGGAALSGLYAATGFGLPCPFLALTGWQCPLCGATRMGAALLHLDPSAAFAANPLVLVVLGLLAVLAGVWVAELGGGPAVRPPSWLRRIPLLVWLAVGLAAAGIFTVARHLLTVL